MELETLLNVWTAYEERSGTGSCVTKMGVVCVTCVSCSGCPVVRLSGQEEADIFRFSVPNDSFRAGGFLFFPFLQISFYGVLWVDSGFFWIERLIDFIWVVDICLSFVTSYRKPDMSFEKSLRKCAVKYVSTWFVVDVLSTIPWDIISYVGDKSEYFLVRNTKAGKDVEKSFCTCP